MGKHPHDSRREALCAWLAANGINPADVPEDGDLTIDKGPTGRFIRCEVFDRTTDGKLQTDERGENVATMVVNVPLKTEPPAWWQPYQKPTRDELLGTLKRVQELAERWRYTADRKGGPRNELLRALGKHAPTDRP